MPNPIVKINSGSIVLSAAKYAAIFGPYSPYRATDIYSILLKAECKNVICWLEAGQGPKLGYRLVGDWPSMVATDKYFEAQHPVNRPFVAIFQEPSEVRIYFERSEVRSHMYPVINPVDALGFLTTHIDIAMDYFLVDREGLLKKIENTLFEIDNAFAYAAYMACVELLKRVISLSKRDGSVEELEKLISGFLSERRMGSVVV